MRLRLVSISILVFAGLACSRAEAAGCIDPATLASATASITRLFDDNDADAPANLRGVRGTGWFLSPTSMVTIQHVSDEMRLSAHGWTPIDIRSGASAQSIPVRVQSLVGSGDDKITVLELQ